ncbi:TolC family protein [Botrimarina mediterranea]|uniref:Outer membrane efflux protein n=1 Tax=Botrimarina mediterranea TaxID=2528022 RepID=A0A518K7P1_9BACT|nr:TolC family protein [Botrimarina mediterranea]QDV73787.1 Outer membrane efflux protein [Botrimarina mediterranea]
MARNQAIFYALATIAVVFTPGCRGTRQIRDAEYARVADAVTYANTTLVAADSAVAPPTPQFEGPQQVEELIQFALAQNPEVQAARKRIEAAALMVPVEASLPDPMLGVTTFPEPVQTAAGQQELLLNVNQKFPARRKLGSRAGVAESKADVARARLAAVELATVEQVKQAYYELYFIQQAISITESEEEELVKIRDTANARYKATLTSQQDVLRAELELSNIANELIRLRQQLDSTQARLARVLHVSPQTRLRAVDRLTNEAAPQDLAWLERRAVAARPELHAQLAALERDRRAAQLARLDYVPDVTLGATWIDTASAGISPVANGQDAVLLTAGVNLPIYRKRLDSAVRSAEASAVATARDYDALRDATLEQVADLFAKARSQQDLLLLFREDILPKARQTLEVSNRAYSVGEVDFLQLIDNFRLLLRYEVSYRRLEASLRQTTASLERVVGGPLPQSAETVPPPQQVDDENDGEPNQLPAPTEAN